ncbi:MAG TPA: HD domain-containing phosphohydrolase [Burkholderiales bacterium]|nr:HD domain-containing phosphohydrolase [Burkholderiales bacterium]
MRKEVPVEELQFGVYIAELDRPWTDTPFLFQGFVLENEQQLETLKKYCKKVYIDADKGLDLPDRSQLRAGPIGAPGRPSVLASIKQKTHYEEKTTLSVELPAARQAQSRADVVLKDALATVRAGKALDAPRVREAVTSMTDSVVRNPDAMMLLAKMKEKDGHTLDRALGVSIYMITFGRFLQLPREQLDLLGMLGLLQDIGKVRLPAGLLAKSGPLSEDEHKICRSHVEHSVAILQQTTGLPAELPALAALHHERYDGSGYPKGLKGQEIGLYGAIAGLVDCFDALTQPRPYGEALAPSNALGMLYSWRDTLFDGPLVEQFIQCIGIYPVGSIVELNSGEIGIVIAQNLARRLLPRVMVVLDAKGAPLRPQKILDLSKNPKVNPETPYRIKRTLEKGSVPIDPSEFFL